MSFQMPAGYDAWKLDTPPWYDGPECGDGTANCDTDGHCDCYRDYAPCCDCGAERAGAEEGN